MNSFNRVDFIGREKELENIQKLLKMKHQESIILVEGIGGIGKTRLLEETYQRFSKSYKVCKIIDFDNNFFQIQGSIISHIAQELRDENFFNKYFQLKEGYEKFEQELEIGDLTLKDSVEGFTMFFKG